MEKVVHGLFQETSTAAHMETAQDNLVQGTPITVKDDNIPFLQWMVAVIEDIHPRSNGLAQVTYLCVENTLARHQSMSW
jgi:hypothetical protein